MQVERKSFAFAYKSFNCTYDMVEEVLAIKLVYWQAIQH